MLGRKVAFAWGEVRRDEPGAGGRQDDYLIMKAKGRAWYCKLPTLGDFLLGHLQDNYFKSYILVVIVLLVVAAFVLVNPIAVFAFLVFI